MSRALGFAGMFVLLLAAPVASAGSYTVHLGTRADDSMYITPKALRVDEGERVSVTIVNDDPDVPHDWALLSYGGYDIEGYTAGGETKTIAFSATEVGEFRVLCQVMGHKQRGMEGTLVVDDKLFVPELAAPLSLVGVALLALALRRR